METRALLFTGVGQVSVGVVDVPEPGPGEVLIEAVLTGISPGTEKRCLAGLQEGAPPFPFVPGYSLVGRVVRGGGLPKGARVVCSGTARLTGAGRLWGGHLACAVQAQNNVHLLPESVSLEAASLARLAAIAYHGVRLARPRPHESVAVVGLGPIGLLSARLFAAAGCRVIGVDPVATRRALLSEAAESFEAARSVLPEGADIVVDATGVPAALAKSVALARELPWGDHNEEGARVLVQGSYPSDFALPYGEAFTKELQLLFPRDNQPRDVRAVLDLMARGKLIVEDLLGGTFAPQDAPEVYARLTDPERGDLIAAAFDWRLSNG